MATRQYIGARYVPKFYENSNNTSEWQAGVIYEPLTIVTWNGNSYTSKKTVPAGIGQPNLYPEYWAPTGLYNEQVEQLRQEMVAIEQATRLNSKPFKDKHILIIGDSWAAGYNGSGPTVGWTPTFIDTLECTADVDYESGAGFEQLAQTNGSLHPGYSLTGVLDFYSGNSYYAVIVQTGVNDINFSTSSATLSAAMDMFVSKCKDYWPNAKIIFLPCYAKHYVPSAKVQYAATLINHGIQLGMDVCQDCINWPLFGGAAVKGNDNSHLSLTGYQMLGRWAAAYCNGWDGQFYPEDIAYQEDGGRESYAYNIQWQADSIVHPTFTKRLYVRSCEDVVAVVASFVVNTSETSGSYPIITGMPVEKTHGGCFLDVQMSTELEKIRPRAYINDGTLYLEIFGNQNLSGARVEVTGHYHTKQNCY